MTLQILNLKQVFFKIKIFFKRRRLCNLRKYTNLDKSFIVCKDSLNVSVLEILTIFGFNLYQISNIKYLEIMFLLQELKVLKNEIVKI